MLPGEVPSDLDINEENHDNLEGRWSILVDLRSEFGGAFGAYMLFAFLIPGLLVGSVYFEWTNRPELTLMIAFLAFVAFMTVSLYSYVWYRWVGKREAKTLQLLMKRGEEELEAKERPR